MGCGHGRSLRGARMRSVLVEAVRLVPTRDADDGVIDCCLDEPHVKKSLGMSNDWRIGSYRVGPYLVPLGDHARITGRWFGPCSTTRGGNQGHRHEQRDGKRPDVALKSAHDRSFLASPQLAAGRE